MRTLRCVVDKFTYPNIIKDLCSPEDESITVYQYQDMLKVPASQQIPEHQNCHWLCHIKHVKVSPIWIIAYFMASVQRNLISWYILNPKVILSKYGKIHKCAVHV
jgi:hypothetical protein